MRYENVWLYRLRFVANIWMAYDYNCDATKYMWFGPSDKTKVICFDQNCIK